VSEVAKLVAIVLCILSLYALFNTAFLAPFSDIHQRIWDSLVLLPLAAGISLMSGLIFRDARQGTRPGGARLTTTLPVQMFCWASATMLVLFLISWYLESQCIFDPKVRY
jgi:hypothetical protein